MPGMMRCVIMGIEVLVASCMCCVHSSKCVFISSKVGFVCVGTVYRDSVCLYLVQLALWKDLRGRMRICMGIAEIVAISGMWSEGVMDPGCRCMLWNALLLVMTMSGDIVLLCVMRAGKYGPIWVHLCRVMSECNCLPTWLEDEFPSVKCRAFRSARRYTGWGWSLFKSVWKSMRGLCGVGCMPWNNC
jgi:hypothetical protein